MTGGGITWSRGEIGPCRFGYFTLAVNLVAGVKSFKSSSETFTSELMTTPRAANRAPSRLPICLTSDLRQGAHFSGLRKFSFNRRLKFVKLGEFVLER